MKQLIKDSEAEVRSEAVLQIHNVLREGIEDA